MGVVVDNRNTGCLPDQVETALHATERAHCLRGIRRRHAEQMYERDRAGSVEHVMPPGILRNARAHHAAVGKAHIEIARDAMRFVVDDLIVELIAETIREESVTGRTGNPHERLVFTAHHIRPVRRHR